MPITNDLLHEKLTALQQQRDQLVAQANQVTGAILMVEQLIKEEAEKQTAERVLEDTPSL